MKKLFTALLIICVMTMLSACGKYYMVTDPSSDKTYYTEKIKSKKEGAVTFSDSVSGSDVTLQNSEVTQISKEKYMEETTAPKSE